MQRRTIVLEAPGELVAGKRMTVQGALPWELLVLRPDTFVFDHENDWLIESFAICTSDNEQLRSGTIARDFAKWLKRGGADTIQRRMEFSMDVIAQKNGLKFRCEITGDAILMPAPTESAAG